MLLLMTLAAVLGLPLLGALFGLLQLLVYRTLVAAGRLQSDAVPFFGILWLRGMIAGFVLVAVIAVTMPRS